MRGVLVDEQDALALLCDQIAVERFADQAERLLRQVERQLLRAPPEWEWVLLGWPPVPVRPLRRA